MIVPGGGISLGGASWIRCRPGFLLPVRVLSRLFRRLMLDGLAAAHAAGRLVFFGDLGPLKDARAFVRHLAPLRRKDWFVYAKPPFAGPRAVLAYLSRYTHRVAIANSRLVAATDEGVTFRVKDYRRNGRERYRTMTLPPHEFIRRFLLHVLPKGFHRIRHYGLLAGASRKANLAQARELLAIPEAEASTSAEPGRSTARPPAAMPVLRRPHDHRRDLRARPPSPGAAGVPSRPSRRVMIRNDTLSSRLATGALASGPPSIATRFLQRPAERPETAINAARISMTQSASPPPSPFPPADPRTNSRRTRRRPGNTLAAIPKSP